MRVTDALQAACASLWHAPTRFPTRTHTLVLSLVVLFHSDSRARALTLSLVLNLSCARSLFITFAVSLAYAPHSVGIDVVSCVVFDARVGTRRYRVSSLGGMKRLVLYRTREGEDEDDDLEGVSAARAGG
eukprot:241527-Rhodomonas_salina.4